MRNRENLGKKRPTGKKREEDHEGLGMYDVEGTEEEWDELVKRKKDLEKEEDRLKKILEEKEVELEQARRDQQRVKEAEEEQERREEESATPRLLNQTDNIGSYCPMQPFPQSSDISTKLYLRRRLGYYSPNHYWRIWNRQTYTMMRFKSVMSR